MPGDGIQRGKTCIWKETLHMLITFMTSADTSNCGIQIFILRNKWMLYYKFDIFKINLSDTLI